MCRPPIALWSRANAIQLYPDHKGIIPPVLRYNAGSQDVPGDKSMGSQDIRERGGYGVLQIVQPGKELTSIATDIKRLPYPSGS